MSRFNGWVQMPRQHLGSVLNDEITGFEHHALMILTLLADAATGGDRINAPLLCYYTGQMFNHDTAQRLLKSLHEKGYIWYRAKPYSKKPQPYWVHRYVLTKGFYKLRRINLSQLYEKETISQDDVWKSALQPTEQDTVQTTEQDADNYKTRDMRIEKQNNTSIGKGVSASLSDSMSASQTASRIAHEAGVSHSRMHHECITAASLVHHSEMPETVHDTQPWSWGDPISGYAFRCGDDAGYYDIATNRRLVYDEAVKAAKGQIQ